EIIPELSALYGCEQNTNYHLYDVYEHTALALSSIENDKTLRLTMLLHDIAKPLCKTTDLNGVDHFKGHAYLGETMARDILKRLRYDNATVNRVSHLIGLHSERTPKSKIEAKLMLCEIGVDDYKAFMKIRRADCLAKANPHSHDEKLKNMQAFLDEIEKNNECWSLVQLKINGNDLKQLGFKSGKKLSAVLRALLFEVIEEEIPNDSEELKKRACELL
ncbi:MAG TPA: polynucleotide adenylyltransferase, partial [Ruminococcaceae bacterium]|nr:polynucleotide adenylyltransferase [Oscillospiraceae bacterium]